MSRAVLFVVVALLQAVPTMAAVQMKPSCVLVVAGTQVQDSHVIDGAGDTGAIVALLKLWGVPFDVLRLDVHSMGAADFVDAAGHPRYGAVVWTAAEQDAYAWQAQDWSVLTHALMAAHVSLIAVGGRIRQPEIASSLGISYVATQPMTADTVLADKSQTHFIIRGLEGQTVPAAEAFGNFFGAPGPGTKVSVSGTGVTVLASAGGLPQLTVRTVDTASRTRAVWIGGNGDLVFAASPTFITLFRRALVWAVGYAVYKDYGHSVVLRMDDPGCAQSAYLKCTRAPWYYQELEQADWTTRVIQPLSARGAKVGIGFCAGYPLPSRQTVVRSWTVHDESYCVDCRDRRGCVANPQRIDSVVQGILDAVKADVAEVHAHGLTHMLPDLRDWWTSTPTNEWGKVGWYREFYDQRHGLEIDPGVQASRLTQAATWVTERFGRPPLMFIPPGHALSGASADGAARYEGGGKGLGAIVLSISGAVPNATYGASYGNTKWTRLGALVTDGLGNGRAVLALPAEILGTTGRYIALDRGPTQLIAGPIAGPLAQGFATSALRDRAHMSPAERAKFSLATDTLGSGYVNGSSYRPNHVAPAYTYAIAADAGYGLASDSVVHYLGRDWVVTLPQSGLANAGLADPKPAVWRTQIAALQSYFNRGAPGVFYHHDVDLRLQPDFYSTVLDRILAAWGDVHWLTMDEWSAYLHAVLDARAPTADSARLEFTYDDHYARYFATRPSAWTLHLADELRAELQALGKTDVVVDRAVSAVVDSATYFTETRALRIPPGTGSHAIVYRRSTSHP
jgi:hypothetical protein